MMRLARGARAASRAGAVVVCAAAAAAAGCRGAHEDAAESAGGADLQRDLDAAAASAAFAPPIRGEAPARFVSALELGVSPNPAGPARASAPKGHAAGRARAGRSTSPTVTLVRARHAAVAPTAGAAVAVAAPAAAPAAAPVAAPAPAPAPAEEVADASAGGGSFTPGTLPAPAAASEPSRGGGGGGGGWGGLIGVVLRGGMAGVDHCDPQHQSGRRPGIYRPGGRRLPGAVMSGGFIGVSLSNPPQVVVEPPGDRSMGGPGRRPGRL